VLFMGAYTELNCALSLKRNTPDQIIDALLFIRRQDEAEPTNLPVHPLFATARWRELLRGSDAAAYTYSNARLDAADSGRYRVIIRCTLKDHDTEFSQFIEWIKPHIHAPRGDFIGTSYPMTLRGITFNPDRTHTVPVRNEVDGEPV
jgi:hypothetical protein